MLVLVPCRSFLSSGLLGGCVCRFACSDYPVERASPMLLLCCVEGTQGAFLLGGILGGGLDIDY